MRKTAPIAMSRRLQAAAVKHGKAAEAPCVTILINVVYIQAYTQPMSWVTCLDHLLYVVGDMLEEAGSHVWRAVNDEAHREGSPAGERGHEGAGVRRVCWHSKGSHELEGTLHASLHPGHVSEEGIAPQRAGKQRVSCHCGNVHLACRAQAEALKWRCSPEDSDGNARAS